ncbi:uncharacterized protein N7496_010294 [Penicillium cataractarum]|uniref:DSBA-like thioredoxin domain-containing protein n=1 Tax=Penicillium cataractarum TaxID=2100454 RepID=A0A9W9RR10_9EURO|nr:uncharacterized protein N7496_010294 [Penicillium cataractarum]KAJ5364581.1 hypothetical protein N7496_010294 [Penicillium cataractarum]
MTNFKIQIISDTICPWCYVGYRRLSRAITAHTSKNPQDTFTLTWNAFYLNPASPEFPGVNKAEMYAVKFGPERGGYLLPSLCQEAKRANSNVPAPPSASGAGAGSPVVGGLQTRVAEKLFRAYFEDEKNITDPRVLLEAGVEAGLDREEVKKLLDSEEGGAEVDSEAKTASRRLVTGVPYFSIQGKYSVEGADEPETFLEVFEQVKEDENV